ncbi:YHS domain protein [Sulfitobacter albidus]|uniref:YHS domain protein n=1 Tax=Sulfitobacter albidus TaxID=2829501 RepID=A0A975JEM8_9RHOB|nr:YHS domain-containing (seleno)protein [Sulfitobacter albidus]QUJ77099.1 YHS domain protein [Sulfitobacter albidus]
MNRRAFILLTGAAGALPATAFAGGTKPVALNADGAALDGYDTRAYWTVAQATDGTDAHVVDWNGAAWRFASAADAEAFAAAPERFAPQFGGFCTRAMSFGKEVNGDPQVWRIFEDRLYVFAKPVGGRKFDGAEAAMIAKAQAHWDTL